MTTKKSYKYCNICKMRYEYEGGEKCPLCKSTKNDRDLQRGWKGNKFSIRGKAYENKRYD